MVKRICVFCGSSSGLNPLYRESATQVGKLLVKKGLGLVYGGGNVGLMGAVADSVMEAGGEAIGVIPKALLERELGHRHLTELHVVKSMHERKAMMAELSIGFMALPGGFGTFEEFFEVVTWSLLGVHRKPCGLLNVEHYYDPLLALRDHAVTEGFIRPEDAQLVLSDDDPDRLLDTLISYQMPEATKWLKSSQV